MSDDRRDSNPNLSKSLYMKGLQCHKALWLHKYAPELKDEESDSQQSLFDSGIDVGILAQQLFPGGVEVPYDGLTPAEQLAMTRNEIAKGTATIYEATFSFDGIFVKVDILHHSENGWEIHEVKASTGLKDVHLNDIALQYYVLAGCGINLAKAALVHINNQYVRQGNIEVGKLFTILDVTGDVRAMQQDVAANITAIRAMLQGDMPAIDIGPHCSDPYECSFSGHCWGHLPENSLFDFRGPGRPDAFELYRQGIVKMEDVPRDVLGWRQKMQLDGLLHRKNHVDVEAVREFLDSLWYPLAFLDFETTYMTPVPLFDGTRPYQLVPFQYSLHIVEYEGGRVEHREFLAQPGEDPQAAFTTSLLAAIPDNACVLTYNQTFEIGRLKELAERFPEHRDRIGRITANVRDLMAPFRSRHIYFPEMGGSHSIKVVLPALVPELKYEGLEVSNGAMAAEAYLRMRLLKGPAEVERIRKALLDYCCLDTLAMVRIVERIRKMV